MGASWLIGNRKTIGGVGSTCFSVVVPATSTNSGVNLDLLLQDENGAAVDAQSDALYLVTILNPSTIAQLSVTAYNKHASFSSGVDYFAKLTNWTVAASSTNTEIDDFLVQGLFVGEGARLTLTAASTAANFNALVRITKP